MTDESSLEQRVRARAYTFWLDEGQPHGRDKAHWEAARAAIAAEDHQKQRDAEDRKKQSEQRGDETDGRHRSCAEPPLFVPPFVFWPWAWWR